MSSECSHPSDDELWRQTNLNYLKRAIVQRYSLQICLMTLYLLSFHLGLARGTYSGSWIICPICRLYYAGSLPPNPGSSSSLVAPSPSNASVSDLGPSSKNVPVVAPTRAINNNPSDPLAGGFGSSQSPTPPASNSSGPIADPSQNTGGQTSSPSTGVVDTTSSTGVIREAG